MTLKELAVLFNVKPWTSIQKMLGELEAAGRIAKVGRKYRATPAEHPHVEEAIGEAERKKEKARGQSGDPEPGPSEQESSSVDEDEPGRQAGKKRRTR